MTLPPSVQSGRFYHFTVVLVFTNSCINPLIYAAKYREFQTGLRSLATRLGIKQHQIQSQQQLDSVSYRAADQRTEAKYR